MILIVRAKTRQKASYYLKALLLLVLVAFLITQMFNWLNSYTATGWMKESRPTGHPMRVDQKIETNAKKATTGSKKANTGSKKANTSKEQPVKETSKSAKEKKEASADNLLETVVKQLQDFYSADK